MNDQYILSIFISVLLSVNGFVLTLFVSNVKELKKAIQELAIAIKGNQKDIEHLERSVSVHEKILEKHSEDIEEIKFHIPEIVTNKKGDHRNAG
jgi:hypothetical protein